MFILKHSNVGRRGNLMITVCANMSVNEPDHMLKRMLSLQKLVSIIFRYKLERMDTFNGVYWGVVTNIRSISFICWYLFLLSNKLKMLSILKSKVDTDTNILKVLGINMKPTPDLQNTRDIPNTVVLKGFYIRSFLGRTHSFSKLCQEIIFSINGQCFSCLK